MIIPKGWERRRRDSRSIEDRRQGPGVSRQVTGTGGRACQGSGYLWGSAGEEEASWWEAGERWGIVAKSPEPDLQPHIPQRPLHAAQSGALDLNYNNSIPPLEEGPGSATKLAWNSRDRGHKAGLILIPLRVTLKALTSTVSLIMLMPKPHKPKELHHSQIQSIALFPYHARPNS